jgi:hypothetical protein
MHTLPTYSPRVPAGWENLLFVISDLGWEGQRTKARLDVSHFDATEQAFREDREWEEEEDWRPMVKIHKGVRVRFRRDEPRGPGTEGAGGDVRGWVLQLYRVSSFTEEYERRYIREGGAPI